MIQRIPHSIWLVTFLLAVLLGIWPGIGLGQQHGIFFGALFGWLMILLELFALLTHASVDNPVFWLQWLAALGYPLAMLGYSVCAYWTICSTRSMRSGLTVTAVAAFVSTLASIPLATVTMSINQHENFFRMLFYYSPALSMHVFILVNLFISAMLGWLIALGLTRLGRDDNSRVAI